MGYFMTRSASQTVYRRMVGWYINDELERIWKEVLVA
jgi:hypothetical protein